MVLTRAVCIRCNGRIAREVETPARDQLAFFQSFWGIRGKSRRAKGVPAIFRYAGEEKPIHLDHGGEPPKAVVLIGCNGEGGTRYRLLGHPCEIERHGQGIKRRHPGLIQDKRQPEMEAAEYEFRIISAKDLIGPILRRLAAKIAFERLAQLRSAAILLEHEFDPIRNFILDGVEGQRSLCGLLWDEEIVRQALPIPLPQHAVCLIGHSADRRLGGFVILYGLFYYWIILSEEYPVLSPWDDTLLIHPQTSEVVNPRLREYQQAARIPWPRLLRANRNALKVADAALTHAIEKLAMAGIVRTPHR